MKYFSTKNKNESFSFKEAVVKGLADDGGLFMPEKIPGLQNSLISKILDLNLSQIAMLALEPYAGDEIPEADLLKIVEDTFTFPAPITSVTDHNFILELFHGPTLAFKDFGARFLARVMSYLIKNENEEFNILVATSGDTGSAVSSGFYGVEGINVYILYPSGKVSRLQEKQLTTFGGNITALEIAGTFDDCQKLVKQAFNDENLKAQINISSANSINIARLLPQMIYYFEAYKQLEDKSLPLFFSVPSGNLGNLTAGLMAARMGLPVSKFIAATNNNSVFTEYLDTGEFMPRPSVATISNAMDVGNPSNLERINYLFNNDPELIKKIIFSESFDNLETLKMIKKIYREAKYVLDPHGAVGYLALNSYAEIQKLNDYNGVVLGTAHPAKFRDVIEESTEINIEMPERLENIASKEKYSMNMNNNYLEFKDYLLKN